MVAQEQQEVTLKYSKTFPVFSHKTHKTHKTAKTNINKCGDGQDSTDAYILKQYCLLLSKTK